jgi:uncharacterized protein (DUF433 family)
VDATILTEEDEAVQSSQLLYGKRVVSKLNAIGGEPCIRTTRHTVAGLVEWKKQGVTDARILEHHPELTLVDLAAAWDYYATHREEIEQAIKKAAEA